MFGKAGQHRAQVCNDYTRLADALYCSDPGFAPLAIGGLLITKSGGRVYPDRTGRNSSQPMLNFRRLNQWFEAGEIQGNFGISHFP
jgi:hypothetical protein